MLASPLVLEKDAPPCCTVKSDNLRIPCRSTSYWPQTSQRTMVKRWGGPDCLKKTQQIKKQNIKRSTACKSMLACYWENIQLTFTYLTFMLRNSSGLVIESFVCSSDRDGQKQSIASPREVARRLFTRSSHHLQNDVTSGRDYLQMWPADAHLRTHQRAERMRPSRVSA